MKIKNGVSLNSLEEILADYADLPVAQSDVTGLVSALAGKANAPIAQSDVTGLVSALSGKVSNTDFQAFLDVLDAQPSVINAISYKATTIPTGTATDGELCLCDDGKIYEHIGGAWDAGEALSVGERYWHFLTGSDVSGDSGSHTPGPNFYIYEWDGEAFSTYQVTFGTFACVEDLAKFYWYNGSSVVEFSSTQLSANELLAIQNANLQGTDTVAKVSDIPAPQLTANEVTAIQNASLGGTDTVAKTSDIPAPQLSAGELTAIQNASLVNTDTVAKTSDIPAAQLSSGELTAIQNASLVNTDTVAKTSDIPAAQLTSDELTAIQNANLLNTDTVSKISDFSEYAKLDGSTIFTEEQQFEEGIYCGVSIVDQHTKSLMHFEGTDESTEFNDDVAGNTWTPSGSYIKIDTENKKFGSSSVRISPGGTSKISCNTSEFIIGTNSFTIDFWYYTTGIHNIPITLRLGNDWFTELRLNIYLTYIILKHLTVDRLTIASTKDAWHHVAIVGNGTSIKIYLDGVLQGTYNVAYNFAYTYLSLGCEENTTSVYCWFDELRYSIGIERWTDTFIPPTSAYTSYGEGTVILHAPETSDTLTLTYTNMSNLLTSQLTSDELTAIQNANLQGTDTVAKTSDIITPLYMQNIELPLDRMKVSEYCWTYSTDANYLNCLRANAAISKEGLELYYSIACEAGVYELVCVCPTNGDLGKLNVYVDDVYQGYIDTYTSVLYYNISFSIFLNILTSGNHTIKFVNTKNSSASGYKVIFAKMVLRKIDTNWQFDWSHGRYTNHKVMTNTIIAGNALQRNAEGSMNPFDEYWLQHTPALNDEFWSPTLYLPVGTYELGMTILKNTNEGILSVYENDTLIDTYDFYAAAPEFNVIPTFTVTIDAARATKFKFKALSKHAASSNYYIAISNLYLKKTA